MRMIGIPAEDAPGVAVMIAAGPGALLLTVALGDLRALETLDPTADTDEAEAMKITSTKLLPVTTTERTMKQPHTPPPAPRQRPDQDQKVKRASPGLTALPKTSTHPRNSLSGDPHHAPTLDPCPGHALAPGPGLDASLEATDRLFSRALCSCFSRGFCLMFTSSHFWTCIT